ncbi:MAG TPA: DUF2760 domain-containing protein [Bryobacteraceae bacterium]|nr:DUF2760 domain-containing protein [Bryobacteraceae bacterium]
MSRISLAFRSFFGILFGGELAADIAAAFGYVKPVKEKPAPPPPPLVKMSDGALQILGILQRDSRIIDFLMEDISGYSDDQVGAAVRSLHEQSKASLTRYVKLVPVIDAVEGTFTNSSAARGSGAVKFLGNVPTGPPPKGGTLRHRGWKAESVELPAIAAKQDVTIVAPAEIEIE